MRVLGLDYGSKTVGVAISDTLGWTAQSVETITRKSENKLRQTLARIEELAKLYPKHMNNDEGERCARTEEFKEMLERRLGLPVILQDERMSTVSAERILMEGNVRRENRKEYVDKMAAAFILQTYLDRIKYEQENR